MLVLARRRAADAGREDEARALFERLLAICERPRAALGGVRPGGEAAARQLPAGVHARRPRQLGVQPLAPPRPDAPAAPAASTVRKPVRGQRWPKWCARGSARVTSASLAALRASGPSDVELGDEQVDVAAVALELAAREQQRLAADDRAVLLVDLRRHDQVRLAVLVLEQHEDDAVRGRRPLARDRHARELDPRAVRRLAAARRSSRRRRGRCGRRSCSGWTPTESDVCL